MDQYIDRVFRLPRVWSNEELKKFASLFTGDVVNVSGWKDIDKQGAHYRDYFYNATSYTITNYKTEARGFQGGKDEIFLDLTEDLPPELKGRFDVVFNHTVLEHIFDVHKAFENLCLMSSDILITVVPLVQQMHASYGDYWRFTPLTMGKLFELNGMKMMYSSFNSHSNSSVYLFSIGTKKIEKWENVIPQSVSCVDPYPSLNGFENLVGCHAIQNKKPSFVKRVFRKIL